MIIKLNNLLIRGGLIFPYNEELTNHLVEACRDYVSQEDFDEIHYSNLVVAYIEGDYAKDLQRAVLDFFLKNYNDNSVMPSCVWQTLTFFALYLALKENEDVEKKAIYSCSLQNQLIKCKGQWDKLRFQRELISLYYYMDDYMKNKCDINDVHSTNVLKQIYSENGLLHLTISETIASALKSIGQNAWEYQLNTFLQSDKVKKNEDAYIRVVIVLEYLFINKPWLYLPVDLKYLYAEVFSYPTTQISKLRVVLESIMDEGIVLAEDVKSNSSVILQILKSGVFPQEYSYLDEEFTPYEFMVYLYYELLLEAKLKVYGTE